MAWIPPTSSSINPILASQVQMLGGGDTDITSTPDTMYGLNPEFLSANPQAANWLTYGNWQAMGPESFMVKTGPHTGSVYGYDPTSGAINQIGTQDWFTNPSRLRELAPVLSVGIGAMAAPYLAGLGAGTDAASIYGAGSGWGGDTLSAMGLGGEGAGAGAGTAGAAAGGWAPSGLSSADLSAAGWTPGSYGGSSNLMQTLFGQAGAGAGGLGSNLGLAGGLAQLIGGLYGANQAKNISNLAQQSVPWITGGGQAQAAQQLQQALGGNVSGLPGFQLAQRAAMDKAGRQMAAGGMYGSGAYVPGMATAASNNYMNYMNMLGNMAGVGTQPNYNAMQAGLGGQVTGLSTALQGGLGTIGSLMSMFG